MANRTELKRMVRRALDAKIEEMSAYYRDEIKKVDDLRSHAVKKLREMKAREISTALFKVKGLIINKKRIINGVGLEYFKEYHIRATPEIVRLKKRLEILHEQRDEHPRAIRKIAGDLIDDIDLYGNTKSVQADVDKFRKLKAI